MSNLLTAEPCSPSEGFRLLMGYGNCDKKQGVAMTTNNSGKLNMGGVSAIKAITSERTPQQSTYTNPFGWGHKKPRYYLGTVTK